MKTLLAFVITGFCLCGALSTIRTSGVACASGKEEWKLVWEDQFDGKEPDSAVWTRIPRGKVDWNNTMTLADTCFSMRDGNLVLRGIRAYDGCNDSVEYLTGGLYTKGKKVFSDGRLEIRAKLHGAGGAWPAIWMMPDPTFCEGGESVCRWPFGGEIDIMERLNHDSIAYQTVHSNYTQNLGIRETPLSHSTGAINPDDYNVYAVELSGDSISFYINDNPTFSYPRIETDKEGQYPFNKPFYLLIDMQLGGNWVGAVNPEELPVEMMVDWVRFYKKNN